MSAMATILTASKSELPAETLSSLASSVISSLIAIQKQQKSAGQLEPRHIEQVLDKHTVKMMRRMTAAPAPRMMSDDPLALRQGAACKRNDNRVVAGKQDIDAR